MGMCFQSAKKVLTILIVLSLFSGCGELDTVLPSSGTYQVKALVNDTSLDDCSLINAGDIIRPYFASSVANDPDITGLMVFLRSAKGELWGEKVLYTLKTTADADSETETKTEAKTETKQDAWESGTTTDTVNDAAAEDPASENTVPEEPEKNAAGKNIVIQVKRLDKDLPEFPIPDDLEIGQYTLVFQVLGEKETLYQTERPVYYLDGAQFSLKEIQMYLPGVAPGSRLVPPGVRVMLDARLDFDPRLDPYIVWYNGKKLVSEGSLSEGAASILWEAPDQNGFYTLRAEAFPFRSRQGIAGLSREISIPVSVKAVSENLVAGDSPDLLHWYQFEGSLGDSKSPRSGEWALIPQTDKPPRWSPVGYSYGLSTGADAVYLLPPISFAGKGETKSNGQFLLRFKPVSEGCIFSARFASTVSPGGLALSLGLTGENLTLKLSASEQSTEEISLPVNSLSGEYITVAIDFFILPDSFEVMLSPVYSAQPEDQKLFLDDTAVQNIVKSISLAASLNGECSLKLGAESDFEKTGSASRAAAKTSAPAGAQASVRAAAIWDELAILHPAPVLRAIGPGVISADGNFSGEEKEKSAGAL
jgi:hypothetical protein